MRSASPAVGLSSAVSVVHVNVFDHELRCSFHVKMTLVDSRKASAAGPE